MPARGSRAQARARRVKCLMLDVDGVLTDGRLWYGPGGETLKAFSVLDGHGIRMLLEAGYTVGVLSGRRSAAVEARCTELGMAPVLQGVADKRQALEDLARRLGFALAQIAFMGDDLPDLEALAICGLAAAPPLAHPRVRRRAHRVMRAGAGAGAVRELCEWLLAAAGAGARHGRRTRA